MFSTTSELDVIAFAIACENADRARNARRVRPSERKKGRARTAVIAASRAVGTAAAMALVASAKQIGRTTRAPD